MDEQENPTYSGPSQQSPSHMFHHSRNFGIGGGQFLNVVRGNINVHPPSVAQIERRQLTGITGETTPDRTTRAVSTESGNYCSQLLLEGRGFPLYVPGPQANLPAEYRRTGVAIGDVGRVTPRGTFDFFFNIFLPADHAVNANGVPEDFCPLPLYKPQNVTHLEYDPGTYVSTPSVYELTDEPPSEGFLGSHFSFNCAGSKGAVLALPHGAHSESLESLSSVRQYAKHHAETWYQYVNGPARERDLANGSLCLVTGWEKAKSWGMASYQDVSLQDGFQLSFEPTTDVEDGSKYRWQRGPAKHKCADAPLVEGTPLNQTTFISAFTISLSEGIWGRLFGDVEIGQLTDSSLTKPGHGYVPFGSQSSALSWSLSFFGGGAASGGKQSTGGDPGDKDVILSDAALIPEIVRPSQIINEHILRKFPEAKIVITHDDDWRDILRDNGMQITVRNSSEWTQQIFDQLDITEDDGIMYLTSKSETTRPGDDAVASTITNCSTISTSEPDPSLAARINVNALHGTSEPPPPASDKENDEVGYKNIPSLDAITAITARLRELSVDGTAKPPAADLTEDPETSGSSMKTPERLEYPWTIYHDSKTKEACTPASSPAPTQEGFVARPRESNDHEDGLTVVGEVSTIEEFRRYFNWLKPPSSLERNSNYHLFKSGIQPMWEDEANANGGKWVLTMKDNPALLDWCWNSLAMALVGEELEEGHDLICGAVVSLRSEVDRIQVWTRSKDDVEKINGIGKRLVKLLDVSETDGIGLEFQYNTDEHPLPAKFFAIRSMPAMSYRPTFQPTGRGPVTPWAHAGGGTSWGDAPGLSWANTPAQPQPPWALQMPQQGWGPGGLFGSQSLWGGGHTPPLQSVSTSLSHGFSPPELPSAQPITNPNWFAGGAMRGGGLLVDDDKWEGAAQEDRDGRASAAGARHVDELALTRTHSLGQAQSPKKKRSNSFGEGELQGWALPMTFDQDHLSRRPHDWREGYSPRGSTGPDISSFSSFFRVGKKSNSGTSSFP
ncbi:hypothetical protein C8R44DRAFT_294403 [Mycena epipterygia]|nr:hypothetical protein C8R44DRAFT_294403 [Mycena epipterygia]